MLSICSSVGGPERSALRWPWPDFSSRIFPEHRLLEREIAFNTTPVLESAQRPAPAAIKPVPPSPAHGRLQALLAIAGGFALLAFNHYSVVHQHLYYTKAVFGGPMIIMCGIFGLFEPRIMSRHLPIGKTYPKSVLLLMLLAIVIGGIGGFQLNAWYHG